MRSFNHLKLAPSGILSGGALLGALVLLWAVRDSAIQRGTFWQLDALSAFFLFALCGGSALLLAARPALRLRWQFVAAAVLLALAWCSTLTPVVVIAYLLLALLAADSQQPTQRFSLAWLPSGKASGYLDVPSNWTSLLAAGSLLVGYGALARNGGLLYNNRMAGTALNSFAFFFVLLAALVPLLWGMGDKRSARGGSEWGMAEPEPVNGDHALLQQLLFAETVAPLVQPPVVVDSMLLLRFAWLYPLVRLYSIGPWNNGWSFAALLLGGALALWCAVAALQQPQPAVRGERLSVLYLALALAGIGIGTSAGIVAGCFGILVYLLLLVGQLPSDRAAQLRARPSSLPPSTLTTFAPWLLSSALPFGAPFVAAWMLIGAAVAGGVALLAGLAWLAALLHAFTLAIWGAPTHTRRALYISVATSLALGIGAPLVVRWLIQPVVAQLQGGLTPYGDINIWPWVGLAASDSAHTQVTSLPSIAIVLLMLVLSALAYVLARLLGSSGEWAEAPAGTTINRAALLEQLRAEVPWLSGLLGASPRGQRRPGDGK